MLAVQLVYDIRILQKRVLYRFSNSHTVHLLILSYIMYVRKSANEGGLSSHGRQTRQTRNSRPSQILKKEKRIFRSFYKFYFVTGVYIQLKIMSRACSRDYTHPRHNIPQPYHTNMSSTLTLTEVSVWWSVHSYRVITLTSQFLSANLTDTWNLEE